MILGHIFGIPVEETAAQLVPAGAAAFMLFALAARATLERVRKGTRRR
jgi:hypothetical protein